MNSFYKTVFLCLLYLPFYSMAGMFSPNEETYLELDGEQLKIWNLKEGKLIHSLNLNNSYINEGGNLKIAGIEKHGFITDNGDIALLVLKGIIINSNKKEEKRRVTYLIDFKTKKVIYRKIEETRYGKTKRYLLHPDNQSYFLYELWSSSQLESKITRISLPENKAIDEFKVKLKKLKDPFNSIEGLVYISQDGNQLLISLESANLIYNTNNLNEKPTKSKLSTYGYLWAINSDFTLAYSFSNDEPVHTISASKFKLPKELSFTFNRTKAFLNDGISIALYDGKVIQIYNVQTQTLKNEFAISTEKQNAYQFSLNGKYLFIEYPSKKAVYLTKTGEIVSTFLDVDETLLTGRTWVRSDYIEEIKTLAFEGKEKEAVKKLTELQKLDIRMNSEELEKATFTKLLAQNDQFKELLEKTKLLDDHGEFKGIPEKKYFDNGIGLYELFIAKGKGILYEHETRGKEKALDAASESFQYARNNATKAINKAKTFDVLGLAYYQLGFNIEAMEAYEAGINLENNSRYAFVELATVYMAIRQIIGEELLTIEEKNWPKALRDDYRNTKNRAQDLLDSYIKDFPKDPNGYFLRARTHFGILEDAYTPRMNDAKKAIELFKKQGIEVPANCLKMAQRNM